MQNIKAGRLRIRLEKKPQTQIFPQDVRSICMGIVHDSAPGYPYIANHKHIYPRVHYHLPTGKELSLLGVGDEGLAALNDISGAVLRAETIRIFGEEIPVHGVSMDPFRFRFGQSRKLQHYRSYTPVHFFEKYQYYMERTDDPVTDYTERMKKHFCWLARQLGTEEPDEIKVFLDEVRETDKKIKREAVAYPALDKGVRIYTNMFLPPAIGHSVGLGWGRIEMTPGV